MDAGNIRTLLSDIIYYGQDIYFHGLANPHLPNYHHHSHYHHHRSDLYKSLWTDFAKYIPDFINRLLLMLFIWHSHKTKKQINKTFLIHHLQPESICDEVKPELPVLDLLDSNPPDRTKQFPFLGILFQRFHKVDNAICSCFIKAFLNLQNQRPDYLDLSHHSPSSGLPWCWQCPQKTWETRVTAPLQQVDTYI